MSMRIVPAAGHKSTYGHLAAQSAGAPSAPGVHDQLRSGVGPSVTTRSTTTAIPDSAHPLEARLKAWQGTQDSLKMQGLRRSFGISEPVRRGMELKITRDGGWRPAILGLAGPSVHEDILNGRDTDCSWDDVFQGDELRSIPSFHDEMEKKVRMV